jgi:hypothetical protein
VTADCPTGGNEWKLFVSDVVQQLDIYRRWLVSSASCAALSETCGQLDVMPQKKSPLLLLAANLQSFRHAQPGKTLHFAMERQLFASYLAFK